MNNKAGSGFGAPLERAADSLQALAHAAQAVAFGSVSAAAVVGNLQGTKLLVAAEPHAATLRLCMADDVGHSFAKCQGQHGFLRRTQRNSGGVAVHGNSCGLQGLPGANELGSEPLTAVSADGLAHVGQSGARSLLHVLHLLL